MVSPESCHQDGSTSLSGSGMVISTFHLSFASGTFVSVSRVLDDLPGISYLLEYTMDRLNTRSFQTCNFRQYQVLTAVTQVDSI